MERETARALRQYRDEEMKEYRRRVGDRGGIRFNKRKFRPAPDMVCNCISTVLKDFLIVEIWKK